MPLGDGVRNDVHHSPAGPFNRWGDASGVHALPALHSPSPSLLGGSAARGGQGGAGQRDAPQLAQQQAAMLPSWAVAVLPSWAQERGPLCVIVGLIVAGLLKVVGL